MELLGQSCLSGNYGLVVDFRCLAEKIIFRFKSLAERRKINLDDLLAELKSNVLVLSGSDELTDYQATRKNLYAKLPEGVKKQHRIEAGGLHDEINAHPEAFALKLKRWLESQ